MIRRLSVAFCFFTLGAASAYASSVTPPTFVVDQGVTFTAVDSNFALGRKDAGKDPNPSRAARPASSSSASKLLVGFTEVSTGMLPAKQTSTLLR